MTSIELQLCDIQGRLLKLPVWRKINNAEYIKVFMRSATAKVLFNGEIQGRIRKISL